jgi:VWFA-related protein
MRAAYVAVVAIGLGSIATPTSGQERATFSSRADLVVLHASVTDARGRMVGGLPERSFRVMEDGAPQALRFFLEQDAPAAIGLLIDNSGSMATNRDRVAAAVAALAEAGHPEDEYFAMTFNERVESLMPAGSRFTRDASAVRDAFAAGPPARGRTALYDALLAALDEVGRNPRERKIVVVVSDGGDNASTTTFEEVLSKAQASNAVVYTVALVDPLVRDQNPKLLRRLAVATGGRAFAPSSVERAEEALRDAGEDIRGSYTLAYVSSNPTRNGGLRQVRVEVVSPDGTRLLVRTRTAYLAASEFASEAEVGR